MIPSLVAEELREAVVEYLATTFALCDDDARAALAKFLAGSVRGIFRGPFLRVRLPYRVVDEGWAPPLDWLPEEFEPYEHQAQAFERLSSRDHQPQPTIVTTGTGSGKTECFLYPVLDHCRRARAEGRRGIKALLVYPMNALVTDQARRLAGLLDGDPDLAGVTAGLYIGGRGEHSVADADHLVDKREALRDSPPDILLTNYKMLDLLLLRQQDRGLWAGGPGTLRYVVLDELHTYDGAQGTDVAMLLRRLGARLGLAEPGRPLGPAVPVATSATLGVSGSQAAAALREFAERVFGLPFPAESVVVESRKSVEEACGQVDYTLPIPEVEEVLAVPDDEHLFDGLAALFTERAEPLGAAELGALLRRHPLTQAVLAACSDATRRWDQAIELAVTRAPSWGAVAQQDKQRAHLAFGRYLALLSVAQDPSRPAGRRPRPLFDLEVQLWLREISRLLRAVSATPSFRWFDTAALDPSAAARSGPGDDAEEQAVETEPGEAPPDATLLPAVYCRHCGRAGWLALASELDGGLLFRPLPIYQASMRDPARLRALVRASQDESGALHLDPLDHELRASPNERTVPVLVTQGEAAAASRTCPSCGQPDGIAFLGAHVASLASVGISQLFGSALVEPEERKLLAFTDSVQDASHRAAFFSGRTYRFNLRTTIAGAVADGDPLSLEELGRQLLAEAGDDPAKLHALTPPDLLDHPRVRTLWGHHRDPEGRRLLGRRLALEAALELGLRSRVGRTLELTGTLAAAVDLPNLDDLADLVDEAAERLSGQTVLETGAPGAGAYLLGLVERLRLQGAVAHPWLESYLDEDGNQWRIWGGRPEGMPAFPRGQSRPTFLTTARDGPFDSLSSQARTPTWLADWAMRTLGLDLPGAQRLNRQAVELLADHDVLARRESRRGHLIYGLQPRAVLVHDVPETDDEPAPSLLRCTICLNRHAVPPERVDLWRGMPCLRYRCAGRYQPAPPEASNYYRRLYRSGRMRRVVTAEHTALLDRKARERREERFKAGTRADDPNVLVCTPTLELGIDVGDLSAVLLTSVPRGPAAYVQRVGRAGRASGNAFIAAFLPTEPRALYYLAQPESMLAGEVRPPSCYLDAVEILRRQYLAYLMDLAAAGAAAAPPLPRTIGLLADEGLGPGGYLRAVLGAAPASADGFIALFGEQLRSETAAALRRHAAGELEGSVARALAEWAGRYHDLARRRDRIKSSIERMERLPHLEDAEQRELRRLRGERHAVVELMRTMRGQSTLSALEELGLLPNYTLIDDAATLDVSLWYRGEDDQFEVRRATYQRPAMVALTEFAPGANFYAHGHRMAVDALEIGTASEPLFQDWRLCPECGYGAPEAARARWDACPRCGLAAIADTGARHQLLRLQRVYSLDSDERTRVFDETDERERVPYQTVTAVDVDPAHVEAAWLHQEVTFGMELARATVRRVNLGRSGRPGAQVRVAGAPIAAPRFRTCRHCGAVTGARQDGETEHRGWCQVRSGARREEWNHLALFHELETEAVRLLLPVATVEVGERLVSFKAALLLGLRLDFGGEPEHLEVVTADHPSGTGGPGRRRFLVLHDTVPGGTGYLGRVADPERLRRILERAREAIAVCPCRHEGRTACHRCLLGAVAPQEIGLVSRSLALELLDRLLERWELAPVPTIANVDIGGVEESELERRFRAALRAWAARPGSSATLTARPVADGREALELRLGNGQTTRRYLVQEQVDLATEPRTRPDYLITRQDDKGPQIAVFLDGYRFHAAGPGNRLADDAAKRRAVRASGRLVWSLAWEDVEAFLVAAQAEVVRQPPDRPLLSVVGRRLAQQVHHRRGLDGDGGLEAGAADRNPVRLLLDLLAHPDLDAWERLACSAVAGLARGARSSHHRRDELAGALKGVLAGERLGADEGGPVLAIEARSGAGLPLTALLDTRPEVGGPDAERWTVLAVLDDSAAAIDDQRHQARWRDWLQWGNLLQFLRADGREAVLAVTGEAPVLDPGDLTIVPSPLTEPEPEPLEPGAELGPEALEELELILDEHARELAETVLRRGAPVPVAGYEPETEAAEGWVLEVAWPEPRVAVLVDEDQARDAWLAANGWLARPYRAWSVPDLLTALEERA